MFYNQSDRMFTHHAEGREGTRVPLHNVDDNGERSHQPEEASDSSTAVGTHVGESTWGERDVGGPVSFRNAMLDYEEMRKELSHLSRSRTSKSDSRRPGTSGLRRTSTARSRGRVSRVASNATAPTDIEAQGEEKPDEADEEDFELGDFLKDGHFEKRQEDRSAKKVGVVYKHLTVQGVGATTTFVKTLPSAVIGTFGPDLYKILSRFIPFLPSPGSNGQKRNLIHDFTGVVRDGEMLLVLGRLGSGCSTFLKAVANKRSAFAGVEGEVTYGGIPAAEQAKHYRGEVNYNDEDDQHFPTLTVEQTLNFSLLNN